MDNDDPILAGKGFSTEGSGYSFTVIPESVIQIIDANVNLVWVMGKFEKIKTARFIIKNTQSIFASDDVKTRDGLWKEHCAGDLREFADNDFERDFQRFLKTVPKRQDSDSALQLYNSISAHREFLNSFHHMRKIAIDQAKTLLGKPDLTTIDVKDFDKICTDFVLALHKLFTFNPR
ncbi:MAG: hypothetical protein Q8P17_04260 [bacterium]|nr:hypothetical protein [bacterium]